jgi:hypothetical protein
VAESFVCALCKRTFARVWTDAEADAERARDFPGVPADECDLVCAECYELVRAERDADPTSTYGVYPRRHQRKRAMRNS